MGSAASPEAKRRVQLFPSWRMAGGGYKIQVPRGLHLGGSFDTMRSVGVE
jgi:hypothetical protein